MNPRRLLLELFDDALRAVDGRAAVARVLRETALDSPAVTFAIGKAASAMLLGARDALDDRLRRALLVTKDGHVDPALRDFPALTTLESAHPVPDARSLAAGAALLDALAALAPDEFPLFLVSGGASSLVESLRDDVSLDDLRDLNRRGLAAGWDIATLNAERAKLSRLKGGGVVRLLGESRRALALFVSDVPGDDPDVIGSGLLGRCAGQNDRIDRRIVASNVDAVHAVVTSAAARGLTLTPLPGYLDGDVNDVARRFLHELRACDTDGVVWGGESTVTLPASPGRGGRNQHLALTLAAALRADEPLVILAAGTDGTDGPTDDAGAIIDAGTVSRAGIGGVDVERALAAFDAGLALEAAGDLVHTGTTGTNVGDILIGLRQTGSRVRDLATRRML